MIHDTGRCAERYFLAGGSPAVVGAAVVAALLFGSMLPASPLDAVALLALLSLGLAAPSTTVMVIIAITVLVPWDVQNHLKILDGYNHRGLLFVDALLLIAMIRTSWALVRRRWPYDRPMMLASSLIGIICVATVWGVARGADVSAAGNEGRRVMFAAATFFLAWPLLRDPVARRTLIRWLPVIGLALGMWGIAQWLFDVGYSTAGDVGVRGGLSSRQLQGGMYAYPAAVALSWSALIVGGVKRTSVKVLLTLVLALNTICLFLTFERTLVVSTAAACAFVVFTGGAAARRRAARWSVSLGALLVVAAVVGEAQAHTAFERMALLGNVDSDNSYTHRVIESEVISAEIGAHPLIGSGLGAAVTWGVEDKFATNTTPFADLGYHWLAWKVGLPATALIVAILLRAVFRRSPGFDDDWHALRIGSRGALLALVLIGFMFGVFNALGITAVMGLLVAICYSDATGAGIRGHPMRSSDACETPPQSSDAVIPTMEGAR